MVGGRGGECLERAASAVASDGVGDGVVWTTPAAGWQTRRPPLSDPPGHLCWSDAAPEIRVSEADCRGPAWSHPLLIIISPTLTTIKCIVFVYFYTNKACHTVSLFMVGSIYLFDKDPATLCHRIYGVEVFLSFLISLSVYHLLRIWI